MTSYAFILESTLLSRRVLQCQCFALLSLLSLSLSSNAIAQTTIRVPADAPTVQAGIDAANNGDTVLVSPGTYNENIDFKGKAITVTSASDTDAATATILNGAQDGPVVTFSTNDQK